MSVYKVCSENMLVMRNRPVILSLMCSCHFNRHQRYTEDWSEYLINLELWLLDITETENQQEFGPIFGTNAEENVDQQMYHSQ